MTCEDFRRLVQAENTSRAERAAIYKHSLECGECDAWTQAHPEILDKCSIEEQYRRYLEDMQDDEFRRVAHGPNCIGPNCIGVLWGKPIIQL